MKKSLIILSFILLYSCNNRKQEFSQEQSAKEYLIEKSLSPYELDRYFDSITAEGDHIIVRGDSEYDTVVNHVPIRYIKKRDFDTPIDSNKHKVWR